VATVVREGSRIEYEVTGTGPPLVLLHGHFDTFTRTDLTIPLAREFLGLVLP
jgi:pimeloyl-ACP methyl ester carboxylesterase